MIKDWLILGSVAFSVGFGLSLPLTKDVRQSLLAGATTVPAAGAGVWAVTQRQKQTIATAFSSLQSEVQSLEHQHQDLARSLQQTKLQAGQLEADRQTQENAKQQLEQATAVLESRKRQLEEETYRLQKWLQELRAQETTLNGSLSQLAVDAERGRTQQQTLQSQLSELELQLSQQEIAKQQIDRELANLRRDREQAEAHYQTLQAQIQALANQKQETEQALSDVRDRKQSLEEVLQQLQPEVFHLRQQRDALNEEIKVLSIERNKLTEATQQNQILADTQDEIVQDTHQLAESESESISPSKAPSILHSLALVQHEFDPPTTLEDFRLANPEHTRWLWEDVIEPRWLHRPFLGSVSLPKSRTDEIWGSEDIVDIVGHNLRQQGENNLEYNKLLDRFGDAEQNWLKIFTFAMSEYAYYVESNTGFWQGACDRFQLAYRSDNHNPVPTLRNLAREGIDLLQLPKAIGGHLIVSTLWLQNGIPRYNLNHFAELVEILVGESSWQSLANAEPSLLASELLSLCQRRFAGRTVLIRFLEASCNRGTEPITGHLLQSIANVALELQSQKLRPAEVLLDVKRREAFLTELPRSNFFLRDWEAFLEILSIEPKQTRISEAKRNQKPLSLLLDVDDLLIQLTLPAQKLTNVEWSAGSCFILEADWEGYISESGEVEIEECVETVNSIGESWNWHLLNSDEDCLYEWQLDGITPEFPCVMFDAWSGDRIFTNPDITGSSEIIYFIARTDQIETSPDIEFVEANIPCSIAGWHGQRLRLNAQSTVIKFKFAEQCVDLRWNAIEYTPTLRGLKLKGNKPKFFSVPTLWYPPSLNNVNLNLGIQDLANNVCLTEPQQAVSISSNSAWSAISLDQWITQPGNYEVQLKNAENEWKERFQIDAEYRVCAEDSGFLEELEIADNAGQFFTLPIALQDSSEFWKTTIRITGLWTLENLVLTLTDGENTIFRTVQANPSGILSLEVSTFYDVLPPSNRYAISFQRLGQPAQPLLELNSEMNDVE